MGSLRKASVLLLVPALLVCILPVRMALAADTFEPNNTIAASYRIYAGPKDSYISTSTDVDYYGIYLWSGCEFKATLTVPSGRDYDIQLVNSSGTVLAGSYNGVGVSESFTYTPSSNMFGYLKVYGVSSSYDATYSYRVWAGWTSPTEIAIKYSTSFVNYSGTWYARPWDLTYEKNSSNQPPTRLAAPQSTDTKAIAISTGVPWGNGNKDLCSHVDTKFAANAGSGYAWTKFYDYWYPDDGRRAALYCPNVYYSSTTKDPINSDTVRRSGETDSTRTGWVGIDCCGLYQRCLWLAGFKVTSNSSYEYGRIGNLDSKGATIINTWGDEVDASTLSTTTLAQDVTDWIPCDGTTAITFVTGMGPMRKGDMVVYKNSSGSVVHVGIVSTPGTTQTNSYVHHAVWGCKYSDSVTMTIYWRRSASTQITVLSSGSFKVRRLPTIR